MPYTLYNVPQPIVKGAIGGSEFNQNYFGLLSVRYKIFGLSAFAISKLPTGQSVIGYEVNLPGADTMLFNTNNVNFMSNLRISSDQWSKKPSLVCGGSPAETTMLNILQKHLSTVPQIENTKQNIYEASSALTFTYFAAGSGAAQVADPYSSNVLFTKILYFNDISPGMAHRIEFDLEVPLLNAAAGDFTLQYSLKIEGNEILSSTLVYPAISAVTAIVPVRIGYIFTSATPSVEINVNLPRGIDATEATSSNLDRQFDTTIKVVRYDYVYNPLTDCCNTTCPDNSGVIIPADSSYPPMCASCSAGLIYNSLTKMCQCQTGHYQVVNALTNEVQCFPCFAPLCETCQLATKTVCDSCVTGAATNANGIC